MNTHRIIVAANVMAFSFLCACQGCKKDTPVPVVFDSGPPPVIDAAPAEILPLDTLDAAVEVDAADAAKKPTGSGLTLSQQRAKQCCNALRSQAKAMGNSPESAQLVGLATMCDTIAMNLGPSKGAQAPELEPIRAILRGKPTLPPLCSGL
jgi:hypothetical protein